MRTVIAYSVFLTGIYAGVYYSAAINAIISKLCGLELQQFTIFNYNFIKKDGKLTAVKRGFSPLAFSIFSKEGASETKLSLTELAAIIAEIVLGVIILFWEIIYLWGKTPLFRYIAEFTSGIILYCIMALINWVRTAVEKDSSVDGYTKYIIKQLQIGKNINNIDVSLEKLASLGSPDNMRGIFLSINFMKALYNDKYEDMREPIAISEKFLSRRNVPNKAKEYAINDIFTYYIQPYTIEREGTEGAKNWYDKWIKILKTPYDAGDQRRIAAYNLYVLNDIEAAKRALEISIEKLDEMPCSPFERELHIKEIDKLKQAIYK